MFSLRRLCVACALVSSARQSTASAQTSAQLSLPGVALERDSASRISDAKLAMLPSAQQAQWRAYLARSTKNLVHDHAVVDAELNAAGVAKWKHATYIKAFAIESHWNTEWFRTPAALQLAQNLLSWQTPAGGWSKHVDMAARGRAVGESFFSENDAWQWIGTFDNDATTTQLFLLGHVQLAQPEARIGTAFAKGLAYVLDAQYPNGCWPQVYPLQGGYHDNATFNDDNMSEIGALLTDVANGVYAFVPHAERERAHDAVTQLVRCIVASQVVVKGQRTVWGQQHDAITLAPTSARSYELVSLTGKESAHLVDFLMTLPSPDAHVVAAVYSAIDWFQHNKIHGLRYRDSELTADTSAGPLWARMAEIGTNRPMFFNRDGVTHYEWNALTDRRVGYAWYTDAPIATLAQFAVWSRTHPAPKEKKS